MAEGFALDTGWDAYSAGTKPEIEVNPFAVSVMAEVGIDISGHVPEPVSTYLDENFDIVATVCDNAQKACPVFTGSCKQKIHHGFIDPADATGSDGEITKVYRRVRDEIRVWVDAISWDYLNN